MSLSDIQQRRSQLQKELDELNTKEKQLLSGEKHKKIEYLNTMIDDHNTLHLNLIYAQDKLNKQGSKIKDYLRNNPEVDDSTYHELIRGFISRIKKLMYNHTTIIGDEGIVGIYNFVFYNLGYHFEMELGLSNKPQEEDILPTREERIAADILGVDLTLHRSLRTF